MHTVQETNTGTTTYGYDSVGNLQSVTYPNGVVLTYGYDTRNRLTNLGVTKGATTVASYAYTLDAAGHRTGVTELSGRTVNYGYDSIYRLTSETIAGDPNNVNGAASYVYDAVGNRTQKTSTIPGFPGGLTNYNANDQLSTDTYDNNGNTTASNGLGYVYDFENHVIQAGAGITMVYDGDGNRVQKTVAGVTTKYLVDTQSPTSYAQVVYETFSGSTSANHETGRIFVYGLERISQLRSYVLNNASHTQTSYYVYDGHGSTRALTDPNGAVTDTYDYDAFGNLLHSTATGIPPGGTTVTATPNEFLFAGEQFDSDLNLYYNRARYLNVSTGRFWSMDSLDGNYEIPVSLHKYVYAENDATDFIDPTGHLLSTTIYGQAVHDAIGADFELKVPGGIYNKSVKRILGIWVPGLSLRPDLTDTFNHLGYEIKPFGSAAQGAAQLAAYLFALTLFDPGRNVWLPGELYIPPTGIILNGHAVAIVSPPIAGVIIYEVVDEVEITGIVAMVTAGLFADLVGSIGVATLATAY